MFGTRSRFRNAKFVIAIVLGCCATASVAGWSLNAHFARGQGREKVIDKAFTRSSPVVEISEVKVSQNAVQLGKAFDGDDDWPGKVFLKVKNVSRKPILYLQLNINFPETRASGAMMSYPVIFGQMPGSKFPQTADPIFMMPGDTLEIPLDEHYGALEAFVKTRSPMKEMRKVELEIGFVIFADKTAWVAGEYKIQDPNNPDRYVPVGPDPPEK